jgi:hypothetical protein
MVEASDARSQDMTKVLEARRVGAPNMGGASDMRSWGVARALGARQVDAST